MFEIIFTRPLTIYNTTEAIISALFSRAKPLRSPRFVTFNLFNFDRKRCDMIERFSRPFSLLHCDLLEKGFVLSVFSKDGFLSFTFFPSDSQLCVAGFLIRQLFYSDLLDMEMIITNSVLSASLYYIISYPARPRRIIIIKYRNLVELPEPTEINATYICLKCLKGRK